MTPKEELVYLSDLLMQAALWRIDDDDPRRPLELEVQERISRLSESLADAAPAAIAAAAADVPHSEKVRVLMENGKYRWFRREDCEQVPIPFGKGFKWRLKYVNSAGMAVGEEVKE